MTTTSSKVKMSNIETGKCPRCGIDIIANIPWIEGNLAGYKSKDHGCGEEVTLVVFYAPENDTEFIDTVKEIKETLDE